jgi:dipeptidyl aminopeptidase/acylaminoacyl peptidase
VRDLAPQLIPADFPAARLVTPRQVIFTAADGMQIHGQLFLPAPGTHSERHPAIVFFHGGSRRQMLLGWHYMQYYSNAYAMNQYLASLGYIVLSVNYRSGIGFGLNFREALNYGAGGASEFNDVLGAGLYLRSRADVDGAHIGVWGGSYGGYLTALALARASDLFAAGVDLHGVHDWNLELTNWQPAYNPDADPAAARLAWESSPLASVKTWKSPVLLMQGDDDRNVQFSNTVRLASALRAQGVPFEEHVFPDEIHDFLLHRTWVAAYGYAADFFDRHLKAVPAQEKSETR